MCEHRKVVRKKRLLKRRERDNRKWRAANNIQNTSLVNSPGTEQWPVKTGDTSPGWGTAGYPLSHEMTAEGAGLEETQTCEQCQSQFFVSEYKMCQFDQSCVKCTECCLNNQEDNPEEWRASHHLEEEEEEEKKCIHESCGWFAAMCEKCKISCRLCCLYDHPCVGEPTSEDTPKDQPAVVHQHELQPSNRDKEKAFSQDEMEKPFSQDEMQLSNRD